MNHPESQENKSQEEPDSEMRRTKNRTKERGPKKQSDSREHLGVNREHKTETMRRRHRGTFP